MTNIAEPPAIPVPGAKLWPLSVAAYHALGEAGLIPQRTELLYGLVYTKMPKSPLHTALVLRLIRLIEAILPKGFLIRPEQPITCADSEPEPDISVVRGDESDFWHRHPTTAELVIEICVTSHNYDRSKLRAYAAAGVKECWLVLGPEKEIEVHANPSPTGFLESLKISDRISSVAFPSLKIALAELFSPVQPK